MRLGTVSEDRVRCLCFAKTPSGDQVIDLLVLMACRTGAAHRFAHRPYRRAVQQRDGPRTVDLSGYREAFGATLESGGLRARQLLQSDIERINVHPVLDAAKPFARAEVISTGKGLLDRVAIMVAGERFGRGASGPGARVIEFSFRAEA